LDGEKIPQWKDLSGEERYRVVELARKGEMEIGELCRTFGVSRQTLYRALDAADRAGVEALTPKPRGRKPRPVPEKKVASLKSEKAKLEKELKRMTQRYEVAQALLDLQRKAARGERLPGEKKVRKRSRGADTRSAPPPGTTIRMVGGGDGGGAGGDAGSAGSVDPPAGD
jgi:transposase